MIQRIKSVQPLPDYMLSIVFDNGRHVLYDVKEDMNLPGYDARRRITGLFPKCSLLPAVLAFTGMTRSTCQAIFSIPTVSVFEMLLPAKTGTPHFQAFRSMIQKRKPRSLRASFFVCCFSVPYLAM